MKRRTQTQAGSSQRRPGKILVAVRIPERLDEAWAREAYDKRMTKTEILVKALSRRLKLKIPTA